MEYELRDIKEDKPTFEELSKWHKMSGLPLKKFFNTSGLLYKSMELKDKLPEMSEDEQLKLLTTDGMLVKRPILVGEDFILVGFKEKSGGKNLKKYKMFLHCPFYSIAVMIKYNYKQIIFEDTL